MPKAHRKLIRFPPLTWRTNGIVPYLSAPVSFKRLLGGWPSAKKSADPNYHEADQHACRNTEQCSHWRDDRILISELTTGS